MARAAVLGRLTWLAPQLAGVREETATARTLVLDVPGWVGHLPGQHVDVRLTAEDGYFAWHPDDPQPILLIGGGPTGFVESAARLLVEQGLRTFRVVICVMEACYVSHRGAAVPP